MDTFVVCLFYVQPSLRVQYYSPAANSDSDWNIVTALSPKCLLCWRNTVSLPQAEEHPVHLDGTALLSFEGQTNG